MNPFDFAVRKKFGEQLFFIRPAIRDDRQKVWLSYKKAPKDFFRTIIDVTGEIMEQWYPLDTDIDYSLVLPFNVFKLEDEHEGDFVANMTLMFYANPRYRHIATMGISVLPAYQKRGIGTFLTQMSIQVAEKLPNILRVELNVVSLNKSARKIYYNCGYQEEGIMRSRWRYPDGLFDDIVIMSVIFEDKLAMAQSHQ